MFADTNSAKSDINTLNDVFRGEVVAIVGLGGTGAYILDLIAKTKVDQIRLFDFDIFALHNAFRRPGSTILGDFNKQKVDLYKDSYSTFHRNIVSYNVAFGSGREHLMAGVTFAFLCVDKGKAREECSRILNGLGIPFIDTGTGVTRQSDGKLSVQIRCTLPSKRSVDELICDGLLPNADADNEYTRNPQLAELNALNASLAVMVYKQRRGYYSGAVDHEMVIFQGDSMKVLAP